MNAPPIVVEPGQPGYPARLQEIANPAPTLHIRGALPAGPAVALAGARAADREGLAWTRQVASHLSRLGVTILSGGAKGIDQAALEGALDGGGAPVLVLPCGLDHEYPAGSGRLRDQVAQTGAILSPYPEGTAARPGQFQVRNRVLLAMADLVVIVQGGDRSGALALAALARDFGRPIMAVPGRPNAVLSKGPHQLLRQGALLAENVEDVLESLGLLSGNAPERAPAPVSVAVSPEQAEVVHALDQGPATADDLARRLQWPVGRVRGTLVELELGGLVTGRGGWYERIPGAVAVGETLTT